MRTDNIALPLDPTQMTVIDMFDAIKTLRSITLKLNDLTYAVHVEESMSFNKAAEEMLGDLCVALADYEVEE